MISTKSLSSLLCAPLVAISLMASTSVSAQTGYTPSVPFNNFLSRSGDKLYDGSTQFRFIGANMPSIMVIEDGDWEHAADNWHRVTEFELRDAFLSDK